MLGRVYMIAAPDGRHYIGSTTKTVQQRFNRHRNNWVYYKRTGRGYVSLYELFDAFGTDACEANCIKIYDVCDRRHLAVYEQLWIQKLQPVNKIPAFCIRPFFERLHAATYRDQHQTQIVEYRSFVATCSCGHRVTQGNIARHRRSRKHVQNEKITPECREVVNSNRECREAQN
jgi:predicted GIY-YIG superfamily endonuclease